MAYDPSIFLLPLNVADEPGLSPLDPRLNTITDLAEQRKFSAAAELSAQLLDEQVYDIRPISLYLLGVFLEQGFGALGGILSALGSLLGPNLAAVGPVKRREEQFSRRIVWLFDTVMDLLKYHQTKRSPDWERWVQGASAQALDDALAASSELGAQLASDTMRNAHNALSRLSLWLREQSATLQAPPPAAAVAVAVAAPAPPSVAPPSRAAVAPAGAAPPVAAPVDPLEPVRRRVELEVSHRFIELWVKLRAFETLVEKKQFDRAALVGSDLMSAIEQFDPRDYFPELFSRFSALSSKHVGALSDHAPNPESDVWKAMVQFYRVDLKGFVND